MGKKTPDAPAVPNAGQIAAAQQGIKFGIKEIIKNGAKATGSKLSKKQLQKGIGEIKSKYKNQIKFTDTLNCINYKK